MENKTMSTTSANGRAQRKSLAEQIDRLDAILDGFADNLNAVVVQAVKEAVSLAVEAALTEVLTNAELQQRLHPQPAKAGNSTLSWLWGGLVGKVKGVCSWLANVIGRGREKMADAAAVVGEGGKVLVHSVRCGLSAFAHWIWFTGVVTWSLVRHFRKPLLVALVSGLVIGLGCYLAGPAVSSMVSGLAGFIASLAASALGRLRWMIRCAAQPEWYVGRLP
jgi:hypothetical protein